MKKFYSILSMTLFGLVVALVFGIVTEDVVATGSPYYTFTSDNDEGFIKTSDAYTPYTQISMAGDEEFDTLEYVYVDHEDYVYVTDSQTSKVYIYDNNYNFVDAIDFTGNDEVEGFYAVNSVFVTEDKVYVPDSFRAVIYIFDREEVLNREKAYFLWFEDVDGDDEMSTGDIFYADDGNDTPTGEPLYEIEVTGQNEEGRDIIDFKDVATGDVLLTKTDRDELLGKVMGWIERDHNGKTLKRVQVLEQKNEPIQVITKPDAPVFQEGYTFAPQKVAVDTRGNMYIVGARSSSGLIMLTSDNVFVSFFGANTLRTPLVDSLRSLMFSDEQRERLRENSDIYIDYISSVAIDEKGYVYTVTSTLEQDAVKKFNVSGVNYFNAQVGWVGAVDLWVGNYGNVIVIEEYGWITEYNSEGELVFTFNVQDLGINREGLVSLPKSIAADSQDRIYVVDQGNGFIQVYEPTEFTNAIHTAFQAYQDGDEDLAKENWEYSIEYATVFDLAHEGLGNAYVRLENYEAALEQYRLASYNPGISDTYWNVRQSWLEENLEIAFLVIALFFIIRAIFKAVNKRKHFTKPLEDLVKKGKERNKVFRELFYIGHFIKHPLDGFYEIKRRNKVGMLTATIIYVLLGVLYILSQKATNIIFISDPNANVFYELLIITLLMGLWVIANYFVCLVKDGEGSFKNVYVATAMTLTPFLLVVPFVIILSNVLTYQEAVFYNGPLIITFIWVAIYFFFMIKEIHNYEVSETVSVIFISMFTMLIMGIFIFVVYSINTQIFTVGEQIARELIQR